MISIRTSLKILLFVEKLSTNCKAPVWLNPFPNKPWFLCVFHTSLLKTLWEKKKLLVTSNFSFPPSVFYPFWELYIIFVKFKIVVCKHFQFGII